MLQPFTQPSSTYLDLLVEDVRTHDHGQISLGHSVAHLLQTGHNQNNHKFKRSVVSRVEREREGGGRHDRGLAETQR